VFNLLDEFKNRTQLKTAKKVVFYFCFYLFSLRKNIYRLSFFFLLVLFCSSFIPPGPAYLLFFLFLKLLATKYCIFSHSLSHSFAVSVRSLPVSVDTLSKVLLHKWNILSIFRITKHYHALLCIDNRYNIFYFCVHDCNIVYHLFMTN